MIDFNKVARGSGTEPRDNTGNVHNVSLADKR